MCMCMCMCMYIHVHVYELLYCICIIMYCTVMGVDMGGCELRLLLLALQVELNVTLPGGDGKDRSFKVS